jgi:SAM-dependent methyltransferase
MKALKKDSTPSEFRLWYNDWVEKNAKGKVLDVGKSRFWDYGFDTIDIKTSLNPTIVGDIQETGLLADTYDTILCNGMYECVDDPQKMVDEVMRLLAYNGIAIFGFVGKDYYPYRKGWKSYTKGDIDFDFFEILEEKDFDNKYHFIVCKSLDQSS